MPLGDSPPIILTESHASRHDPNLVTWDSPEDPQNPLNWPSSTRWTLIVLVSAAAFTSGLASSMFAPAVPTLMEEFNTTNQALGTFVVTIYVLGMAAGPIVFGPFAELYGRMIIQHIGNIGLLVMTIACAVSSSFEMMIGFRLVQGIFGAVPLTNGGALIADMVRQERRGRAMGFYTVGVLLAPVVGPVAGGFLSQAKGWRWTFWLLAILQGALTLVSLLVWRESYMPLLLSRKAKRLRKETGNQALYTTFDTGLSPRAHFVNGILRAGKMLVISAIVPSLSIYIGVAFSYFYLLLATLTPIFERIYGFGPGVVGLVYLGLGVGFFTGLTLFSFFSDRIVKGLAARNGGVMKPEFRLPPAFLGGISTPIALFWYGWTAQAKTHWILPIAGTGFIGLANSLLFMSLTTYLIDAFTVYAASAVGACVIVRSIMAAVLPLAAPKMYNSLGYGWGNSLLAFLSIAMIPLPWLLFFYGERIRNWDAARIKRL
ncbi:MFS general substrate transporter [Lophium mytilinum]|uniref:MFS general substrate transporter n=1 Tax=Lophium mytilinum TaxID=390894 RepID=A0A6A6QL97_9PEZI|nr:MFS general substrate transporter [Lophium mytilinum]